MTLNHIENGLLQVKKYSISNRLWSTFFNTAIFKIGIFMKSICIAKMVIHTLYMFYFNTWISNKYSTINFSGWCRFFGNTICGIWSWEYYFSHWLSHIDRWIKHSFILPRSFVCFCFLLGIQACKPLFEVIDTSPWLILSFF